MYSAAGKNLMLAALAGVTPAAPITHAALFYTAAGVTAVNGVASTDTFQKVAHGLVNGDVGVFRGGAGGASFANEVPYFVVNAAADTFQLSRSSGGVVADLSADLTSISFYKLAEISGGSPAYARQPISFNVPVDGAIEMSANIIFDVPVCSIEYVAYFSAVTGGNLLGISSVEPVAFVAQNTYTVTAVLMDLNTGGY